MAGLQRTVLWFVELLVDAGLTSQQKIGQGLAW